MMFLGGVGVLLFLGLYHGLVPGRWQRPAFAAVSLSLLTWFFPLSVLTVAGLTVAVHALLPPTPREGDGGSDGQAGWGRAIAATVLCLVVLVAQRELCVPGGPIAPIVGVSYAAFRLIHVSWEAARRRLAVGSLWELLEYVLFVPSFLSGPIERFASFTGGIDRSGLSLDRAFWAARRILTGLLKKVLVVDPLRGVLDGIMAPGHLPTVGEAWLGVAVASLVVYLDFSAYCDIALGVARLFGYRLSENFDWPYLASDITEFWRRWHITLSSWLRDYVYLPLSARLLRVASLRARPVLVGVLAVTATMVLCGAWHGRDARFWFWGLGHGLLCSIQLVFRQRIVGSRPSTRKALDQSPVFRAFSTLLTFAAVSLLWVPFFLPLERALPYWRLLFGL
ncbi:MAG: MBOAT family protein [Candidatus Riflebacteria bacterium]|nr:MBOAT family protein [Candidatus Riflebacteria bacterium]